MGPGQESVPAPQGKSSQGTTSVAWSKKLQPFRKGDFGVMALADKMVSHAGLVFP